MDSEVSEKKRLQVYGAPLFLRSLTIRLEFETNGWKSFIIKTEERDPNTTNHIFRTMTIVKLQMNATTDNHNSTTKNKTDPGNKRDGQKSL